MAEYGVYLYGDLISGQRVEIQRRNWTGDAVSFEQFDVEGIELKGLNDSSVGGVPIAIQKSSLTIRVRDVGQIDFSQLFTADATRYKVLYYENGVVAWAGYLTPDSYSQDYGAYPIISLIARDNLGYLDQLDFDVPDEFMTIAELVTMAQERISWAMGAIMWRGSAMYSESGSVSVQDATISTRLFEGGTWWEALEQVMVSIGCQVRYGGENRYFIQPQGDIYDLGNVGGEKEIEYLQGSGVKSIIPSWRQIYLKQDYGKTDEYKFSNLKTSGYEFADRITQTLGFTKAGGDYYTNTEKWKSVPNSEGKEVLLSMPSKRVQVDEQGEKLQWSIDEWAWQDKYLFISHFNSSESGISDPYIYYPIPVCQMQEGVSLQITTDGLFGNFSTVTSNQDYITKATRYNPHTNYQLRVKVMFVSESAQIYYFNAGEWSTDINEWEVVKFNAEYQGWQSSSEDGDAATFTINVMTVPEDVGDLRLCILPLFFPEYNYIINFGNAMRITNVAISSLAEITGKDIIGLLNPHGNVEDVVDIKIGEVPQKTGDYLSYAGGLFDNSVYHKALTTWRRLDSKGGVMPFGEIVARSYAHLFTAFKSANGELVGGTQIEGTIKFASSLDFVRRYVVNGKRYILTSARYNVVAGTASVILREVLPYEHSESTEYNTNVVDTGGGISLSSGSSTVITWGGEGSGEYEIRRIGDLPTAPSAEGRYIMVDGGGVTAEKISAENIGLRPHAETHAIGGDDVLTPSAIGAAKKAGDAAQDFAAKTLTAGTVTSSNLQSDNFQEGLMTVGHKISQDPDTGKATLRISTIIADETIADLTTIQEVRSIGGVQILSQANATIVRVEAVEGATRCYYIPQTGAQMWRADDQILCKVPNRYYWALVEAVSTEATAEGEWWFDVSNTIKDGSGIPSEGDEAMLCGARGADLSRRNFLILSGGTLGYEDPLAYYEGVNTFSLYGKKITNIGKNTKITAETVSFVSPGGEITRQPNDRGVWAAGTYYPLDKVTYNGELWFCIAEVSTTDEPSASSPNWRRETENSYNDGVNLLNDSAVTATTTRFYGIDTAEVLRDYVGKEIVLSFDAWINEGGIEREIRVYPYQNSGISILDTKDFVFTKQRQRFYLKTTVYDWGLKPDLTSGVIAFYDFAGNNSYSIANRMIEKGNAESTWRLSPEDVRADYTMVSEELSTAKANAAKVEAEAYADGIVSESEATQIRYVDAEILELETKQTAYTDGKVTDAEEEAIRLAKVYTDSAAELTQTTANAYADGIVDAEEARAIADATAKANAAQAAAEQAAMQMVEDVKVGGVNLQLHSAFTKVTDVENVVGASVSIVDGYVAMLRQGATGGGFLYCFPLTEPVDADAEVTFSFDIKRLNNNYNLVRVSPNGNNPLVDINTQNLSEVDFKRISVTFTPRQYIAGEHFNYLLFELYGNGGNPDVYVSVRNIQVEKGNKMTSWKLSPLDAKREAQQPFLPPAMTDAEWGIFDDLTKDAAFLFKDNKMLANTAIIRNLTSQNIDVANLAAEKVIIRDKNGYYLMTINLDGDGSQVFYAANNIPRMRNYANRDPENNFAGTQLLNSDGSVLRELTLYGTYVGSSIGAYEKVAMAVLSENLNDPTLSAFWAGQSVDIPQARYVVLSENTKDDVWFYRAGSDDPYRDDYNGKRFYSATTPTTTPDNPAFEHINGYFTDIGEAMIREIAPNIFEYTRTIQRWQDGFLTQTKNYTYLKLNG